ncbi:MAG: CBS domain-containing protein [Chloroflexi bacterium]|nr:CBS domain-containing protein [Chloroflexota bacterium]
MNAGKAVRVRDLMATDIRSVDGMATVADAISMMKEHGVSSLAVNRRDEDDEIGLVLISDIASKVTVPDRSPDRVNVYEIMSKPAITVSEEMLARYAIRLLVRFDISRAMVLDAGRNPVGIVTLRDLVLGEHTE